MGRIARGHYLPTLKNTYHKPCRPVLRPVGEKTAAQKAKIAALKETQAKKVKVRSVGQTSKPSGQVPHVVRKTAAHAETAQFSKGRKREIKLAVIGKDQGSKTSEQVENNGVPKARQDKKELGRTRRQDLSFKEFMQNRFFYSGECVPVNRAERAESLRVLQEEIEGIEKQCQKLCDELDLTLSYLGDFCQSIRFFKDCELTSSNSFKRYFCHLKLGNILSFIYPNREFSQECNGELRSINVYSKWPGILVYNDPYRQFSQEYNEELHSIITLLDEIKKKWSQFNEGSEAADNDALHESVEEVEAKLNRIDNLPSFMRTTLSNILERTWVDENVKTELARLFLKPKSDLSKRPGIEVVREPYEKMGDKLRKEIVFNADIIESLYSTLYFELHRWTRFYEELDVSEITSDDFDELIFISKELLRIMELLGLKKPEDISEIDYFKSFKTYTPKIDEKLRAGLEEIAGEDSKDLKNIAILDLYNKQSLRSQVKDLFQKCSDAVTSTNKIDDDFEVNQRKKTVSKRRNTNLVRRHLQRLASHSRGSSK